MPYKKRITKCDRCGKTRAGDDHSVWTYMDIYGDTSETTEQGHALMMMNYRYCPSCMGMIAAAMRPSWDTNHAEMPAVEPITRDPVVPNGVAH